MTDSPWYVYLLKCTNSSIYTGIAKNVRQRYAQHLAGKGARYTRAHKPEKLLVSFPCNDRSEALKLEHAIKQLTPQGKRDIATTQQLPQSLQSTL